MADSDYDSRDDRDRRRDDSRDDDRPRRRRDDDRPAKKGCSPWVIVLGILGVLGLACAGGCVWFGMWSMGLAESAKKAADAVLVKAGNGDMAGAYAGMSATYKATHTQADFEKAIKAANLTDYVSAEYTNSQSNSRGGSSEMTLSGTAKLKSGATTPIMVKLTIQPDLKTFEVEDIGGTTFTPAGDMKSPMTGPTTPPTGK